MSYPETIETALTKRLNIKVPILLAGMNGVAHAELCAAVTNAGGLGVIGGLSLNPKMLRKEIKEVKELLTDPSLPFGVDLAIPQVGGSARKTNHDYTHGKLPELVDIMIEEKIALFVCAVGVPPRWATDKLHAAGIPVMNMVGARKHAVKALDAGADFICCQGTEGGGHTGEVASVTLWPQCVDVCKGRVAPIDGGDVLVVAAGGVTDGRSLAAALALGCAGVWVGTRFVASVESAAPQRHKDAVVNATSLDTLRTILYTGRPLRTLRTDYVDSWLKDRKGEVEKLCDQGIVPWTSELKAFNAGELKNPKFSFAKSFPLLMGSNAGAIDDIKPAKQIMEEMVADAIETMRSQIPRIAKL